MLGIATVQMSALIGRVWGVQGQGGAHVWGEEKGDSIASVPLTMLRS